MKTIILSALIALVSTGCESIQSLGLQGGYNPDTSEATGGVVITFKGANGIGKAVLSRANSRGYSVNGTQFVSLGDLKTIAIALYNEPSSNPAGFSQLTADDTRIVAIVLASLAKNSAQPGTLR